MNQDAWLAFQTHGRDILDLLSRRDIADSIRAIDREGDAPFRSWSFPPVFLADLFFGLTGRLWPATAILSFELPHSGYCSPHVL